MDKISALEKRDQERKLDIECRRYGNAEREATNEKLAVFENIFKTKRSEIEGLIGNSTNLDKSYLAEHFNEISKLILTLQKYVAQSTLFLRTYDVKKCQESLTELTNKSKELEETLLPKKKFGFKNKLAPKIVETVPSKDEIDCSVKPQIYENLCGFYNKSDEELILDNTEINKKDISVENLKNCTVKLFGNPSTLHLNNLTDCKVFSGPVSTSIFANNCTNCTLIIACQQLRLHSSKNVNIYLHVTSRAIMEDCHNIFLAPYNWNYDQLDEDFKNSGLHRNTNNWKSVDDFNWLNLEQQSPNWGLIEENNLILDWK